MSAGTSRTGGRLCPLTARTIHEWPIDEGAVARVITTATSVVAVTIARLILDPFGL